ncbi:MAG: hypothetical protein M9891_06835 [Austwickia sp.]|nr:hypothetical protein [Austwickia sp.]
MAGDDVLHTRVPASHEPWPTTPTRGAREVGFEGRVAQLNGHAARLGTGNTAVPASFALDGSIHGCSGLVLTDWDWDRVPASRVAPNGREGWYRLVGTHEGSTFTVTRPVAPMPPRPAVVPREDIVPCAEPAGGWRHPEPGRATSAHFEAARHVAQRQPGFVMVWFDQKPARAVGREMAAYNADLSIVCVTVHGETETVRDRIREVYGGMLCIAAWPVSGATLLGIERELRDASDVIDAGVRLPGRVEATVVDDAEGRLQTMYDARYGPGIVRIHSQLRSVPGDASTRWQG